MSSLPRDIPRESTVDDSAGGSVAAKAKNYGPIIMIALGALVIWGLMKGVRS